VNTALPETINRTLPLWEASPELLAEATRLQKVAVTHPYHPREHELFDELVEAEELDHVRARLHSFLSQEQLAALMAGVEFQIGRLSVRSCAFEYGDDIHLQVQRQSGAQWGLVTPQEMRFFPELEDFSYDTVCHSNGNWPGELTDSLFEYFANSIKWGKRRIWTQDTRSVEEMLQMVCRDCVVRAHMFGVQADCSHGTLRKVCSSCAAQERRADAALVKGRKALVTKVVAITGSASNAQALRKVKDLPKVKKLLAAHLAKGDCVYTVARALNWHVNTLTALL
jgi:hypothetical protein